MLLVEKLFLFLVFLRWAKILARFPCSLIPFTFQLVQRTAEASPLIMLLQFYTCPSPAAPSGSSLGAWILIHKVQSCKKNNLRKTTQNSSKKAALNPKLIKTHPDCIFASLAEVNCCQLPQSPHWSSNNGPSTQSRTNLGGLPNVLKESHSVLNKLRQCQWQRTVVDICSSGHGCTRNITNLFMNMNCGLTR